MMAAEKAAGFANEKYAQAGAKIVSSYDITLLVGGCGRKATGFANFSLRNYEEKSK